MSLLLEQVQPEPDWIGALHVALVRPEGVPERRAGEDPWRPSDVERPRRISDDLAWFRDAVDDPADHGLRMLTETATVAAWIPGTTEAEKLERLRERGVLDAAGFLLHDEDPTADILAGA